MSAIDSSPEDLRNGPGLIFWLGWVAATLAGSLLPLAWSDVTGLTFGPFVGLIDATWILGLVVSFASVGIAQALVLLPYFKMQGSLEWLAASVVGQVLTLLLQIAMFSAILSGLALNSWIGPIWASCFLPIIAVVITTLPQWYVLRDRVAFAHRWVLANLVATLILVLVFIPLITSTNLALTGPAIQVIGVLIVAGITGYTMERLMRTPGPKAEWDFGLKPPPKISRRYREEAQASPEELLERRRSETAQARDL
jgi:hypothetical protein